MEILLNALLCISVSFLVN